MPGRIHVVREPAAAGSFYPLDPLILSSTLDRLARQARPVADLRPKALVVPHSKYRQSGRMATRAYLSARQQRPETKRVVVIGPAHFSSVAGIAIPRADGFATPLGELPIDDELRSAASECEGVIFDDLPHVDEHSLEVQLPFLQRFFGDVAILPVAVARVPGWVVAQLLQAVWGGSETLIVVSTDLSHYLRQEEATLRDRATAAAIAEMRAADLQPEDTCGFYPLIGFLYAAEHHRLKGRVLEVWNSADATGDHTDIIGFGSIAFEEPPTTAQGDTQN